jgi:SAM-dependent methyltransferase
MAYVSSFSSPAVGCCDACRRGSGGCASTRFGERYFRDDEDDEDDRDDQQHDEERRGPRSLDGMPALGRGSDRIFVVRGPAPYDAIAPSYDAALGRASLGRAVALLRHVIKRYGIAFRSAADLGCGTGLFAAYLARRWRIPVYAIDRSPAMLREALRNGSSRHVVLMRQDVRALTLPRPVDLMTANFDALNYILHPADLMGTFRRVHRGLRPGGHFVFDVVTDRLPWRAARPYARRLPGPAGGLSQRLVWDPVQRLIATTLTRGLGRRGQAVEQHLQRAYPASEVVRLLRQAGFSVPAVLDAATGGHAGSDCPRILVVARRVKQRQ